jgi:predicted Zn finger-like uncharacterized protein
MIITCPCKKKKFEIDAALIPAEGRKLKCGSCDEVWFYKKNDEFPKDINIKIQDIQSNKNISDNFQKKRKKNYLKKKINEKRSSEIVQYTPKPSFTFSKFLSFILVVIISFIALILILDTFKIQLYNIYPRSEVFLFNLYETLKDIQLFIKDLI